MDPTIDYIDDLSPIENYDEFGNLLAKKATPLVENCDIVSYFAPKIEAMKSFSLGIYQWCIVDFADQKLFEIGGMIEEMTGKPYEYWKGLPAERYVQELALPDHIPMWMSYIEYIYTYILNNQSKKFRPHIYLKMKNKDGVFRNVVMQILDWKFEANGGVRYCLCQVTDIAHLEVDYLPQLSILILEGKECKLLKSLPLKIEPEYVEIVQLSKRELEVIQLLSLGLTSKIIADRLSISKNTVENHRQRLLRKTNSYTSSQLITYAINHSLI